MSQLRDVIEECGGVSVVAGRMHVTPQRLSNWIERGVPVEKCARLERALNRKVTRRDLRPDDWREIWPELAANDVGAH